MAVYRSVFFVAGCVLGAIAGIYGTLTEGPNDLEHEVGCGRPSTGKKVHATDTGGLQLEQIYAVLRKKPVVACKESPLSQPLCWKCDTIALVAGNVK